jgi:nucleotide-binding universal stress UspA family protein
MIVAMAVVTTMAMPPMLRWVMARVPLGEEEAKRLDKEEAELAQSLPKMERALVYVDDSPNGRMAAQLAGLFAARQKMLTTVLDALGEKGPGDKAPEQSTSGEKVTEAARVTAEQPRDAQGLVIARPATRDDALQRELARGYDIVFAGLDQPVQPNARHFDARLQLLVASFKGPVAIAVNGAGAAGPADIPLDILLPTSGTADSRLATEIALSFAGASKGRVTALHVFEPRDDTALLRGRARRAGISLLVDAHRLGKRGGVPVKGLTATNSQPDREIQRTLKGGRFDLVVLGTSLRQGETKFLGSRMASLLRRIRTPTVVIAR